MRRILLALTSLLLACHEGGSVDSVSPVPSDGKTDTLVPTGTQDVGYVTFLPADGSALGLSAVPASLEIGGLPVTFGQKVKVAPGQTWVTIVLTETQLRLVFPVWIKPKQDLVTQTAGLHVTGYEYAWSTTFGPSVDDQDSISREVISLASTPGLFVPVAPGPLKFAQAVDGKVIWKQVATLEAGKVQDVAVDRPDPTATFTFESPTRLFPDARSETYFSTGKYQPEVLSVLLDQPVTTRETYLRYYNRSLLLEWLAPDDLQVAANPINKQQYFVWLNGTYTKHFIPAGTVQTVAIRRLDVDDVVVTNEDGTTFTTPGTYTVEWQQPDLSYRKIPSLATLPTKTGVDLVPGHYRVTVEHVSAGLPSHKTNVYEMDL